MKTAAVWVSLCVCAMGAERYDVVVYGGTAAGVATAVSAAREGARVVLLEPGKRLGGMMSGGLGETDFGKKEAIGGLAREFFRRVGAHYGTAQYGDDVAWYFEPHVAEAVFREMLGEAKVRVVFGARLKEHGGVVKSGARIVSMATEDGTEYEARVFADCTYEGDLMAQAKVTYTWGREAAAQYGEALGGVRGRTPFHQFLVAVKAFDGEGKLLPEISPDPPGEAGAGDRKVQAYNFRLCLTQRADDMVAFPKPEGYDARRYELLARWIAALGERDGHAPRMKDMMFFGRIPEGKTDINNNGAFSTDYIGGSWEYPEASYARRAEIWKAHVEYTQGFFWFLGHDARAPESLRAEVGTWGLAKDEFAETGHWPAQLYIREARRMVGDFVMTQKDLQTELTKADSIGMGSYNSDSHNVERVATREGLAQNEGDMQVPVKPYEIPYRVLLPKRGEAENLLVPVCFSASHVAYSSVRMEPQYMILGQAAGVAAGMAAKRGLAVQAVDVGVLRERLREGGAVLAWGER